MVEDNVARRKTHIDISASYAAIGASQAEDLLKFPPAGSTPFEHECMLGSGENRFLRASSLLMTWGAQLGAGLKVNVVRVETVDHYRSTHVTDTGQPTFTSSQEQSFAEDGTPYLQVGSVVRFTSDDYEQEMRVLIAIDEPRRVGFVLGTTSPQEVNGEEFFTVELREDDTVWAVVRGFYHQGDTGVFGMRSKKRLKKLIAAARDQIVALTPASVAASRADSETSD